MGKVRVGYIRPLPISKVATLPRIVELDLPGPLPRAGELPRTGAV
jgi:hypothetical protein